MCACGDHAFANTSRWGVAIVSACDIAILAARAWTLITPKGGGWYAYNDNIRKYLHRHLADYARTDHKNGNGLDCRRGNMRAATPGENARNVRKHRDGTARFKGVYLLPSGRWNAKLFYHGNRVNVGTFDKDEDAARAYDRAAEIYFGKFARLNFPVPEN